MKLVIHVFLLALCLALMLEPALASSGAEAGTRVDALLEGMSRDEKIAQMIMPALRTWDGENVTELSACPVLAEALRRHPTGA